MSNLNALPDRSDKDDHILIKTSNNIRSVFPADATHNKISVTDTAQEKKAKLARTVINAIQANASGGLQSGDNISELVNDAGYAESVSLQSLGTLPAQTLPNSNSINLANGQVAIGHLGANTVLSLSGASAGDSGIIILGNGTGHDGVGYTVSFNPGETAAHGSSGHEVLVGDLADFAAAPAAGEYNFGTIAWFYTGQEYLLYVSEVKPFTDVVSLPS